MEKPPSRALLKQKRQKEKEAMRVAEVRRIVTLWGLEGVFPEVFRPEYGSIDERACKPRMRKPRKSQAKKPSAPKEAP